MNTEIEIIGLTGNKGSGKDTLALHLIESYGYENLSLAKPLKDAIGLLFNLSQEQIHDAKQKEIVDERYNLTPRRLFQIFGTEVFRESLYDYLPELKDKIPKGEFWLYNIHQRINNLINIGKTRIVITDIRFLNEVEYLKKYFNFKLIRIKRNNIDSSDNNEKLHKNHKSEGEFDEIINKFNSLIIENNGSIDDLYNKFNKLQIINN